MPEEARIVRNMEGFVPNQGIHHVNSPRVRPVIYPVTVTTDTGVGFGNPNMGWYAHHPMPISPGGIGENPNVIYQVGGGIGENHNLVNRVGGGGGVGQYPNYVNRGGCGIVENTNYVNQVGGGTSQNPSPTGRVGGGHGGSATFDQGSEDGVDDQYPGEKIKFLCSFGGKILRRPSDGLLRYAGGHTRIISVTRDISFHDLVHKMNDVCGKPVVIKYQLPDGELDSLVSVSCPEDLENMMEEYEKLAESPSTGSAKLRVFLFSISEFDPSGLGQFSDLLDSGQRYVDAVNGFPDGVSGGLTRKVSIGSVGSAQNSDGPVGGNESVDSSTYTQGDGGGVSSPSMSSPRVAAGPHDSPTSVVYVAPNPVVYAPSMAVGSPTVLTSLPQTFSSLPVERPLPAIGQAYSPLGYDLQKPSGMDYRPASAYMQTYLDPHQHLSSQVGYMNPQGVGIQGSIYRYADPPPQLSQQQFMPAVPMSMNSLDPHPGMNTNAVQHVMQPSQTRVDPYLGENAYKARVVQFPVEQNCHVYQPQSPPQQPTVPLQVGGACGRMPPPTQHVVLSDGRSAHTQGIAPEKLLQLEDCFMCQKALPHAHSDTVVQGQRTCISSTVSDVQLGSQPLNRVVVSGALGEVVCQGLRNQPQPMAQIDHTTSDLGRSGFSQDLELQSDKDRILHKPNNPDNPGGLFSQGVIGRAIDVKSPYGVILHDISPSHHEDGSPQSSVPHLCQVKQEPTGNVSVGSDFSPVDTTTSQNLKPVVPESSTEYSGKKSGHFVNEDIPTFWISYDPIRPVEGRVEKTHVTPPQVVRNNELSSSPFYNHQREDIPVIRSQISGQEMFPSNVKPGNGINPDRNQIMPSGIMPSLSSEVAHFNGNRPVEPNQITNPGMLAISNLCTQPSMGTEHVISEELLHGKPGPKSDYATYKNLSVGETEAEDSGFQSRIASDTMVSSSRPASGDTSSSYGGLRGENWEHSPSNSFYSNRDPWTSQHYSQFISPKANMDGSNEEAFIAKGESHKLSGHLNNYSNSENFRSSKDKAKEYVKQELKSGAAEVPRKTSGHLNMDSSQANKDVADEYIRQELKAVAEGVAAMALQPPLPSDSYAHGRSSISHELIGRVPDSGGESHMDVKTKLAEKQNTGLPLSEGIGRLQIIKNSDLEVLRELGSGTFGTVYHGKWRGSDVAIKRINNRCFSGKPSEQSRMIDDFWNEAINLADLHHPNVVAFYGVVLDGPGDSVATVTEFMVNGSLRHALQRTSDKRKRLLIAMDVAFGMEYLHGKNIVHFDLKSDNLLVNLRDPHRPICKVGDLGLSKVKCNTLISGGVRGTLPWMAPELLNGSSSLVSEKVDVFSFGIVMWELLTGEEPYGDLHYGIIIGGIVSNTLRPSVPESCDPEWKSLMERCWSSDPSERPSFKEISDILRSMSSSVSPKGQT